MLQKVKGATKVVSWDWWVPPQKWPQLWKVQAPAETGNSIRKRLPKI